MPDRESRKKDTSGVNALKKESENGINAFRAEALISMERICTDIFRKNQASIKIKKEGVAVKNLVNIFNTTLTLANEKGFQTMSLRDLSAASGLSMGALYSYFSSKDELLEMILSQGRQMTRSILSRYVHLEEPPEKKLKDAIRTHLYLTEVMQPWFYFAYMEAKNLNRDQQRRVIEGELATEKIFIDILEEGNRIAVFSCDSPVLTASAIKAMLQDWYLKRWKYQRRNITVDEYADFLIGLVEAIVKQEQAWKKMK